MKDKQLNEIVVNLCFSEYEDDPDKISLLLGMDPISIQKVGAYRLGSSVPISRSFWSAKIQEGEGDDVGKLIDEAVRSVANKSAYIASVSESTKNESYIGVTVKVSGNMPSVNIASETLGIMAEMKLSLDIGIFD